MPSPALLVPACDHSWHTATKHDILRQMVRMMAYEPIHSSYMVAVARLNYEAMKPQLALTRWSRHRTPACAQEERGCLMIIGLHKQPSFCLRSTASTNPSLRFLPPVPRALWT